jgi:hypothetical protein
MQYGHFYFLVDDYFVRFPDGYLMQNKGTPFHDRPCFYAFEDNNNRGIYWMIPFSSQIKKYKRIYYSKLHKKGFCDTIVFGKVLGKLKAFLIQNMCPTTVEYIGNEYYSYSEKSMVRIEDFLEEEIINKATKVLALVRNGEPELVFPDILKIEKELLSELGGQ